MLLVAVAVDVVDEVVALVAILGNVSVVDVHVGLMIVATPPAALLGQRGLTPAPPEGGQGSVSNGPSRHVPDAAGSLAPEGAA
jgi:hypothetical protein